jgi:hypothetical protein
MTFDEWLRKRGAIPRDDVAQACRFLEAHGFRFREDFRTSNSIEMAGALILLIEESEGLPAPKKDRKQA